MFEELIFMLGFMIFSIVISYILLNNTPNAIRKIAQSLAIVGIVIHEVCHLLMCFITNTPVKKVTLLKKIRLEEDKSISKYYGKVEVDGEKRLSFLQALLIGLAPLYISFWLFFYLWDIILNPDIEIWLFFAYLLIMISIALAAAPSIADVVTIPKAFKNDIRYSMYQIFLLTLSLLLLFLLVKEFELLIFHEFLYYVIIMLFYYCFKYTFSGFTMFIHTLRVSSDSHYNKPVKDKLSIKQLTRQTHKPLSPRKLGYEEAHW